MTDKTNKKGKEKKDENSVVPLANFLRSKVLLGEIKKKNERVHFFQLQVQEDTDKETISNCHNSLNF